MKLHYLVSLIYVDNMDDDDPYRVSFPQVTTYSQYKGDEDLALEDISANFELYISLLDFENDLNPRIGKPYKLIFEVSTDGMTEDFLLLAHERYVTDKDDEIIVDNRILH